MSSILRGCVAQVRELRPREAVLVLLALAAVFSCAAGRLLPPLFAILLVVGGLLSVAATRRPRLALPAVVVATAALPIYWAPEIPVVRLGATPGVLLPVLLVPLAMQRLPSLRLHALDLAVLAFVALRALSFVVNLDDPKFPLVQLALGVALPYAVFRLIVGAPGMLERLSITVVAVAVPLAALGILEGIGVPNPYFLVQGGGHQAEAWAHADLRFGVARAEASFGHPIAFGLFLLLAALLALALAYRSTSLPPRALAYAALAVIAYGLLLTLSRGPVAAALLGVLALLTHQSGRVALGRIAGTTAFAGLLLWLTPAAQVLVQLQQSLSDSSNEAASASYRLELAQLLLDPRYSSLLGSPFTESSDISVAASQRTGLASIDSELALLLVQSGVLPLIAFLGIGVVLFTSAVAARRGSILGLAWSVASAATFLVLPTVALLTQHAVLFWMTCGVVGAVAAGRRAGHQGATPRAAARATA